MDTDPSLGVWVKRRRRALDLTQEELARRAGYSVVTIRKVETGDLRPSVPLAEQLAEALEVVPEQRQAFVRFARSGRGDEGLALSFATLPEQQRFPVPDQSPSAPPLELEPLVGRQHERAVLQRLWQQAQRGQAQLVALTGESGIGKTRLAEELLAWAAQQGTLVARTRSYAAQGALAYTPISEVLRSETLHSRLAKLENVWLAEVARLLPELLVARPDLPHLEPITTSWQRARLFEALARALLVDNRPLLLLFDDLQWCDRETFEWLQYLLHFARQARLLVAVTLRSEEVGEDHAFTTLQLQLQRTDQMTELPLRPLSQSETTALATEVGGEELSAAQAKLLYQDTEGNPLFVVEMVRAQGHRETVTAVPKSQGDTPTLPPKIYAVIRLRLLHLSAQAQDLTSVAAVIGRSFTLDVLAGASHQDEETLVSSLDELWQRQIVREGESNRYDFSHDKIREVAYGAVSRVRRRLLHHRVAETLARVHAQNLDEVCGQLAAHYEQAGNVAQAVHYYRQAGEVARRISAHIEAIDLYQRGLQILQQLPQSQQRDGQELDLQTALGVPLVITRGYAAPEVRQTYLRAWTLAEQLNQPPSLAILRALALSHLTTGAPRQTHEIGQKLLHLAQQSDDLAFSVEAHYLLGVASYWMGAFSDSLVHLEEAVAHYDPQWHRRNVELYSHDTGCICLIRLALTLWVLGYPERAMAQSRAAFALAQAQNHPFSLAYVHGYSVWLYRERGESALAASECEALLLLCQQHRMAFWPPMAQVIRGALLVAQGKINPGFAQIEQGLAEFAGEELNLQLPYVLAVAAQAYAAAGQAEQGLALVQDALVASTKTEEHFWEAELYRLRGLLLLAQQPTQTVEVEAAFQQALNIATVQEAKALELRAALSLAQLWQAQGKADAAHTLLAAVYRGFDEGFDTADLRAARALLGILASSPNS